MLYEGGLISTSLGKFAQFPLGIVALTLGVLALVLGSLPFASFIAWLPALGAVAIGLFALVRRVGRRWQAVTGIGLAVVAWITAIGVSLSTVALLLSPTMPQAALAPVPTATSVPTQTAEPTRTTTPTPTPTPTPTVDATPLDPVIVVAPNGEPQTGRQAVAAGTLAIDLLNELPVKGRAPKTGYDRAEKFGTAWMDVDRNGCDTRNDILARDLTDIVKAGPCKVTHGTLQDPYRPVDINFVRGNQTSMAVQIDHVVSLMNAWETGAQQLPQASRITFGNDPLNLLAVDGPMNSQKGAGDAATWLPPNNSYRCEYVARQVSVKYAYSLWVTSAERAAITRVLTGCPDQVAYASTFARIPVPTAPAPVPEPEPEPAPEAVPEPAPAPPSSVYYKNCTAARDAGAAPVYAGEPGYGTHLDRDRDGIGCE